MTTDEELVERVDALEDEVGDLLRWVERLEREVEDLRQVNTRQNEVLQLIEDVETLEWRVREIDGDSPAIRSLPGIAADLRQLERKANDRFDALIHALRIEGLDLIGV